MGTEKKVSKLLDKRISRRELVKGGLGAGGLALLAACAPQVAPTPTEAPPTPAVTPSPVPPTPTPTPVPKKTVLRVGLGGPPDFLSTNTNSMATCYSIQPAMYEYLTWVDRATAEVKPMLAKSWKVLDDHLTWEFELQEGVTFHNGEEFDAESVKVTLESMVKEQPPSGPYARLRTATLERVDIVDKYKVHLITQKPYVILPAVMTEVAMYPAKHLSEIGLERFGEDPVGTGKWRLKRWDKGLKTVLERFGDHWGWGKPALVDEIEFRGYPEDATRVAALRADEADIIVNLPADDAEGIEAAGLKVQWTEIAQGMTLNLIPREGTPFVDTRVRQAISHGIDVDSLIKNIMLGFGTKLNGQLTVPGTMGHNPSLKPYPYDPDKARDLLKEAGYADGFTTDFDISAGRYAKQKEMNEALAGQLAQIGVECKINMLEWAVFIDGLVKGTSSPLAYMGWNYFSVMDADLVYQWYVSDAPFPYFRAAPKEMDEALRNSRMEFDIQKRSEYLQEFAAIMREEAPCAFLFAPPDIYGVQPRVKDFVPTRDNTIHFWGIYIEE